MEKEIRISKEVLDELPEDFEETRIGDPRGARRQYRSRKSTVHVRENDEDFTIHIDHADPRKHPLQHLLLDSPETIGALFCANYLGARDDANDSGGLARFLFSFILLNSFFGGIKQLLQLLGF